jgi:hypothetical protein
MEYRYPYILIEELYLWEEEKSIRYEPYPWGLWDPWYPWVYRRYPYW